MASYALSEPHGAPAAGQRSTRDIAPEQFLRRDQCLHFERNGALYATDGRVGRLNRVIVDQDAGEVTELVVTAEATGQMIVIPVGLVEKTGGSAIFLTLDVAGFIEFAHTAPAFDKRRFAKARSRLLRKKGAQAAERHSARAVVQLSSDYVDTPVTSRLERAAEAEPHTP